jgi:tetratricopeptide (TPR) repeat protein
VSAGASTLPCPSCGEENSPFNPRCAYCDAPLPPEPESARTVDLSSSRETADGDDGAPPSSKVDPLATTVHAPDAPGTRAAPAGRSAPEPGERLGRFEVRGRLGRGAMGVVVRALDPVLGREVAIKVLRPEALGRSGGARARARLVREAQAMAKIKHPNVVTVHEVDAAGDQVHVVMEHVEGRTLRAFCEERRGRGAEILEAFVQAGQGLLEVHRAGLVHRDFKPDNVLVGADGRVRVTDFGLVGLAEGEDGEGASDDGAADVEAVLTRGGALLGTPAYMAPEQHQRRPADARADQFAFCVSLWEALAGERPFAGGTYDEIRASVLAGRTREPPRGASIPARIRRVLERGLAVDPGARYPDMASLLAELARDPAASRRRALTAAGALAIAGLAAIGIARIVAPPSRCQGGAAQIEGAWGGVAKAKVRAAFLGTGKPYAEDTYRRVEGALDERARAWIAMYTDSCQATHERGEQSAELLDLRTACLAQRRSEIGALAALLGQAEDTSVLDRAVSATGALPPLEACADAAALRAAAPLPSDPAARAAIEAARARLAEAHARLSAGKGVEAEPIAAGVLAEAERIGWAELRAEAGAALGRARAERDPKGAEAALRDAVMLAGKAKDDRLVAETLIELVHLVGYVQQRFAEGLALETAAAGAVERVGGDPLLRAKLLLQSTKVLSEQGALARALEKSREALAIYERSLGPDALPVADAQERTGNTLARLDRYEEAHAHLARALEARQKALGPDHPQVGQTMSNLGNTLMKRGRLDEAASLQRQALALLERALGPDHVRVANTLGNLALVLENQKKLDEALACHLRALAIREKVLGPNHGDVALTLNNIGVVHDARGKYAEAAAAYERSLAVQEKISGPEHPAVAETLVNIGASLVLQGKREEAIARFEEAIAIWDKRGDADADGLAIALTSLGEAHLEARRPAPALPPLERALAIRERNARDRDPLDLAATRLVLATALGEGGGDRRRAIALAKLSREAWASGGEGSRKDLERARAWLSSHGAP